MERTQHPRDFARARAAVPAGRALFLSLACTLAAVAGPARAGGDDPHLFGQGDGARSRLEDKGIHLKLDYLGQAARNLRGGDRRVTRYADQWLAGASLDLDTLWGWKGARFDLVYTQRDGRHVGADAGIDSAQLLQDVYGRGQTLHLTVMALTQEFLDGRLSWRVGRLPVGRDFAGFACDFENLAFCGAQPGNIVSDYWVNSPTSQWATRLKYQPRDDRYVQLGAYQVNPTYLDDDYAQRNGWKPDFPPGTTGALLPLEFGWTPRFAGLPGTWKFGVWYDTSGGDDLFLDRNRRPMALTGAPPLHRDSRRGAYLDLEQQVTGDPGGRGLHLFFRAAQADHATASLDRQVSLGAVYHGPFGRDDDLAGIGLGATHANGYAARDQRLRNRLDPAGAAPVATGDEVETEVFYRWSPVPAVSVQPDLQYVVRPGAVAGRHAALVAGLVTRVSF